MKIWVSNWYYICMLMWTVITMICSFFYIMNKTRWQVPILCEHGYIILSKIGFMNTGKIWCVEHSREHRYQSLLTSCLICAAIPIHMRLGCTQWWQLKENLGRACICILVSWPLLPTVDEPLLATLKKNACAERHRHDTVHRTEAQLTKGNRPLCHISKRG